MYNFKFKLLLILKYLYLPINFKVLNICFSKKVLVKTLIYYNTTIYSKIYQVLLKLKKSKVL